jgi:hypothetical protein
MLLTEMLANPGTSPFNSMAVLNRWQSLSSCVKFVSLASQSALWVAAESFTTGEPCWSGLSSGHGWHFFPAFRQSLSMLHRSQIMPLLTFLSLAKLLYSWLDEIGGMKLLRIHQIWSLTAD